MTDRSTRTRARRLALLVALLLPCALSAAGTGAAAGTDAADPRITAMKNHPRGPFARILWFCADGRRLPPEPNACKPYGGGSQHGEWTQSTQDLRAAGYHVANVYADLDQAALLAAPRPALALAQMVIERFLMRIDDGWIMRRARYYRGALQEEGERAGARRLLLALAASPVWTGNRFLTWRTLAATLRHGVDGPSARGIRQDASDLARRDTDFVPLKNKIHITPQAADADAVRAYAERHAGSELAAEFTALADAIASLHAIDPGQALAGAIDALAADAPEAARELRRIQARLAAPGARERFQASAAALAALRSVIPQLRDSSARLRALDAGIAVEATHFVAATELAQALATLTRRERLALLGGSVDALFGTGLLSARQHAALHATLARFAAGPLPLPQHRADVDYLGLAPGWGDRHLNFAFGDGMAKLAEIEPLARLFIQDHLRGSPLFFYAEVIGGLQADANRLTGIEHRLFDATVAGGLRALNPGLARGVLRDGRTLAPEAFSADGIYLLDETVAELPPVAGIVTAGEGNPLSHVQLLARNLGIPNVSVAGQRLAELRAHEGERVVMAVSGGGTVHLLADDARFDALFEAAAERPQHLIAADLGKLDLSARTVLDLADLRADDSGRTVGPKAAKLGELKASYPEAVADGLALPFGVFRAVLDRPAPDGSGPMFDYIVAGYRALEALPDGGAARADATETLRATIEQWVGAQRLDDRLAAALRARLQARLGADGSFGVFVRSDTNVEDLPGFTGAGLNLTVPNVVGIDAILAAIPRVWASPFTARAFSWRQALMREPEHVYPAVLLLESVNADKSGVLVTRDIDSGAAGWISVAVNEGVGGAVDGQSAESLRVDLASGEVRLLAQASASLRRQVDPAGGVVKLPASGADAVLQPAEITQLIAFARELPQRFPAIVDADGNPAPADVEFGFRDGRLVLFQIRPFLDNAAARGNAYLIDMDPDPQALADVSVDLDAVPR